MVDITKIKKITYSQIDKMKHTIGFDNRRITGTKHRKFIPYRNYYCASECDFEELDELCELNFMKRYNGNYYCVMEDGKEFLRRVTGVEILKDSR